MWETLKYSFKLLLQFPDRLRAWVTHTADRQQARLTMYYTAKRNPDATAEEMVHTYRIVYRDNEGEECKLTDMELLEIANRSIRRGSYNVE